MDFSRPCPRCVSGDHAACSAGVCGCITPHPDDDATMTGFKALKRRLHPEREAWTAGGWSKPTVP